MARPAPSQTPTSLDAARRERRTAELAGPESDFGQPYVAASDVVAVLNRVGECVRALPSFGRTRTQTAAVVAKRTLSAISTCSPAGLAETDELRSVLARLDVTRDALRVTALSGASDSIPINRCRPPPCAGSGSVSPTTMPRLPRTTAGPPTRT